MVDKFKYYITNFGQVGVTEWVTKKLKIFWLHPFVCDKKLKWKLPPLGFEALVHKLSKVTEKLFMFYNTPDRFKTAVSLIL